MAEAFSWGPGDLRELEGNLLDERSSRWMYLRLAEMDDQRERAELLRSLADFEEKHTGLWEKLLLHLDRRVPGERRMADHRILVLLARLFGVGAVLPIVHKGEVDAIAKYKRQAARWRDPAAQEVFPGILRDEIAHEVDTFNAMRGAGATRGGLRSAILGANDGLGSILALAAGVAGATRSSPLVLMAGVAGLIAGAVSMAASNYVSVKAEQEGYAAHVRIQREAAEAAPEVKGAQLQAAYRAKGLTGAEAEQVVSRLMEKPEEFLRALLAEEHGLAGDHVESPPRLAAYTGLAFILAGLIPILPFLVLPATPGVIASVVLTGVALFFAGVLRALSTLHPFLRSGAEMVLIGMGSATATYMVGLAMGGAVG
ncbi:MAG: VIT1/CCC1 transporter family protein [Euryarchaeota archaeon]|nr:VIT1/CCC1 transporter family protein [Euryarchaeota archaeon]